MDDIYLVYEDDLAKSLSHLVSIHNMDIKTLSDISGIKPGNIRRILSGKFKPDLYVYYLLFRAFGYNFGFFK